MVLKNTLNRVSRYAREKVYFANSQICSRRYLDADRLIRYFELNGCVTVQSPEDADYLILVTCAFHELNERQSFDLINVLAGMPGELIVVGCLPAIAKSRFQKEFKGRYIETARLPEIDSLFRHFKTRFSDVPDSNFFPYRHMDKGGTVISCESKGGEERDEDGRELFRRFLARRLAPWRRRNFERYERRATVSGKGKAETAYLRISYGCNQHCAYCGIRNATGKLRSKPLNVCKKEYQALLDSGFRKFWLVAADTGAYGLDIGRSFADLLDNMTELDREIEVKWCVHELNPIWAVRYEDAIRRRIRLGKIKELIVPIQSGSRKVLKAMNRDYDLEKFGATLRRFREESREVKLITYLLPGFPTETERDFQASLDYVQKVQFDRVVLFVYSDREGIPATILEPKVEKSERRKRAERAVDLLNGRGIECFILEPQE